MKCACQSEGHGHKPGECANEATEAAFCKRCFDLNNAVAAVKRKNAEHFERGGQHKER